MSPTNEIWKSAGLEPNETSLGLRVSRENPDGRNVKGPRSGRVFFVFVLFSPRASRDDARSAYRRVA